MAPAGRLVRRLHLLRFYSLNVISQVFIRMIYQERATSPTIDYIGDEQSYGCPALDSGRKRARIASVRVSGFAIRRPRHELSAAANFCFQIVLHLTKKLVPWSCFLFQTVQSMSLLKCVIYDTPTTQLVRVDRLRLPLGRARETRGYPNNCDAGCLGST